MSAISFDDALSVSSSGRIDESLLRIRLEFLFSDAVCTRDIIISSNTLLADLHTMIQACGNWMNYHLYDFKFIINRELVKSEPRWQAMELEPFDDAGKIIASDSVSIQEALSEFPSMLYSYDYGDGWEINVLLLCPVYGDADHDVPYCIDGKGDWPPEDVGAEGGFLHFLEAIKNPEFEDHEFLKAWGKDQGFTKYNRASCNRRLANWKEYAAIES